MLTGCASALTRITSLSNLDGSYRPAISGEDGDIAVVDYWHDDGGGWIQQTGVYMYTTRTDTHNGTPTGHWVYLGG